MKKFFALLLALTLPAALCGCASEETNQNREAVDELFDLLKGSSASEKTETAEPTQDETTAPTEPETEPTEEETAPIETPTDYSSLVYTGFSDEWSDANQTMTYAIPQIALSSPAIDALNREIMDEYTAMVYADDNGNTAYRSIDYEWGCSGDILSIVMHTENYWYDWPGYAVYYINVATCELAQAEDLLNACGVSWDTYYSGLRQMLAAKWFTRVDSMPDQTMVNPRQDEFAAMQYQKTIAWENVEDSMPYIGADGSVHAVVMSYAVAGADAYWGCYPTSTEYALPDDWETVGTWAVRE